MVDIAVLTRKAFCESIGVYRTRINEAFSPFYWISFIIYLPKNSLKYVGLKTHNSFVKVIQVFYWIISFFVTLLSISDIKFIENLKNWINNL